jgi:hypothetical protein
MFITKELMLLYSCDHGHTVVDNTPEWVTDEPQIEETINEDQEAWSGDRWDYFEVSL